MRFRWILAVGLAASSYLSLSLSPFKRRWESETPPPPPTLPLSYLPIPTHPVSRNPNPNIHLPPQSTFLFLIPLPISQSPSFSSTLLSSKIHSHDLSIRKSFKPFHANAPKSSKPSPPRCGRFSKHQKTGLFPTMKKTLRWDS